MVNGQFTNWITEKIVKYFCTRHVVSDNFIIFQKGNITGIWCFIREERFNRFPKISVIGYEVGIKIFIETFFCFS